jgi:hypothetical protein
LALAPAEIVAAQAEPDAACARPRPQKLPPRISEEELALHAIFVVKELGENAIWNGQA